MTQNKPIIQKLDLTPFSGIDDPEALSEDGLNILLRQVCDMGKKDWEFITCGREDKAPCIIYLHFEKREV